MPAGVTWNRASDSCDSWGVRGQRHVAQIAAATNRSRCSDVSFLSETPKLGLAHAVAALLALAST